MKHTIQAGFGRYDITPEEYMEMAGFGNDSERISTIVLDRLFATCVALRDELGETVLLCTSDLGSSHKTFIVDEAREDINAATGIPVDHIMISVAHNHAAPSPGRASERKARYLDLYRKQMTKAAVDAIADLADAEIVIGSKVGEHMTFDRHYFTNDGMPYGTGVGSLASGIKCHMDKADEQMQLIRFQRKQGRDILLVNWQAHVTFVGNIKTDREMSADYVGAFRNHLEGSTGCHMMFLQGGAGNLAPWSRIPELNKIEKGDYVAYGRNLADFALEILNEAMTPVNSGPIRTKQLQYAAIVDHSQDHLAPIAQEAMDLYNAATDLPPAERKQILLDRGFLSHIRANSVLTRANSGPSVDVELNALSIGDISIVTAPFEMFCSVPMHIKANTPFAMTFFMGYCNGAYAYLADHNGFKYNTYEVQNRRFVEGTAEDIGETHLRMLRELKNSN